MSTAEQPESTPGRSGVSDRVRELARVVPMLDLEQAKPTRRVSLDESARLIQDRYAEAIELLGEL